ncbi:MAG: hypothetical protein ABI822_31545 [Bryobacteraceae bacterium]
MWLTFAVLLRRLGGWQTLAFEVPNYDRPPGKRKVSMVLDPIIGPGITGLGGWFDGDSVGLGGYRFILAAASRD